VTSSFHHHVGPWVQTGGKLALTMSSVKGAPVSPRVAHKDQNKSRPGNQGGLFEESRYDSMR
jgi:hypothetical protein